MFTLKYFYKRIFILFAIIGFIIKNTLNYNNIYNDNAFISYSFGTAYSCYINNNYKMKCFGFNRSKQLECSGYVNVYYSL